MDIKHIFQQIYLVSAKCITQDRSIQVVFVFTQYPYISQLFEELEWRNYLSIEKVEITLCPTLNDIGSLSKGLIQNIESDIRKGNPDAETVLCIHEGLYTGGML